MQAGSSTQSTLINALQIAANSTNPRVGISELLDEIRMASGATGVCLTLLDDVHQHFAVGDTSVWTDDVAILSSWAQDHSADFVRNAEPPETFSPDVSLWYTGKPTERAFMCVWFNQAEANVDESELALHSHVLAVLIKRLADYRTMEGANLLANSIVSSILDPLLVLDERRAVMVMNPAAESLFNTTTKDARGKRLADVVKDERLLDIITTPTIDNVRPPEWTTGEDVTQTFLPLMAVIYTPDGSPNGWVLALRDVTRFKRLNTNQQEFLRVVSHDLRSPLTSMQGFADMIRMGMVGDVTEKQGYFLDKILAGIVQMTGIVDNIQDAGRYDPETGFYDMQRNQVDLGEITQKIVNNQIIPPEKQELSIDLHVADNVPIINADENMLTRGITNMVDNAIKYTPNGSKVVVSVKRDDKNVVISVKDDGYGISEEDQRLLFQRHKRIARKEHKKVKGTGLGLFIVRSVAQRHGGDAKVESVPGEGATFSIVIPLNGENLIGG